MQPMNGILVLTLAFSLQSTVSAASQEARELVRCETAGGYSCGHPDAGLAWGGCLELEQDGEYLLVPHIGDARSVPSWEEVDQGLEVLLTYNRCQRDATCHEIEVRAERHTNDVRLVGQNRWRDYSLELPVRFRATDPPILATEVERYLGAVHVFFWRCPARLSNLGF